jgi:hypothetical protein
MVCRKGPFRHLHAVPAGKSLARFPSKRSVLRLQHVLDEHGRMHAAHHAHSSIAHQHNFERLPLLQVEVAIWKCPTASAAARFGTHHLEIAIKNWSRCLCLQQQNGKSLGLWRAWRGHIAAGECRASKAPRLPVVARSRATPQQLTLSNDRPIIGNADTVQCNSSAHLPVTHD